MVTNPINMGIIEYLINSSILTPVNPVIAITTPETGERERPNEVASCIGSAIYNALTPICFVMLGTKGPKAYHEAYPLPNKITAPNIRHDIKIIVINTPPFNEAKKFATTFIPPIHFIDSANIPAEITIETVFAKHSPIAFKIISIPKPVSFKFLYLKNSNIKVTAKDNKLAVTTLIDTLGTKLKNATKNNGSAGKKI